MQEKRNKRLLVLLLVLLAAMFALLWMTRDKPAYVVAQDLFAKYDLESVDKVELERNNTKVILALKDNRWKVNGRFDADADMVEVLFATLKQAVPKRPVGSSVADSVSTVLATRGVKVSLWSQDRILESFYAGGNESKTQAYFTKVDESSPYVMAIPGYRVYVSGIFELNEFAWRDKYVFGFNWRNFQSLEASYRRPADNVTLRMDKDVVRVEGLAAADTSRVNEYLDRVSLLTVDEYIDGPVSAPGDAVATLLIKDIANHEHTLRLFADEQTRQFYGQINNSDWATFKQSKILPILRPKEFFITK